MKRLIVAGLLGLALVACGNNVAGTAQPTTAPEDRFWNHLMSFPGMSNTIPRSNLVSVGRSICDAGEAGATREAIAQQLLTKRSDGSQPFEGDQVAQVIIDASMANLCPGVVLATEPPKPAGPATTITADGVYEVGVDIEPGKYKTSGGSSCYWARLNANGSDIIDNDLPGGQAVVTVKAGELFKTQRCGTWTKS
jgi:hypothetical protein